MMEGVVRAGQPIRPPRIVVVGGGVSGLAAAFTAVREGAGLLPGLEVVVLEPRPEVGGRATSEADGDWLVEAGPGGYLDVDADVAELVRAVGLEERVVRASAAAARRFVLLEGRLHEVGPHPLKMMRSGLLGPVAMVRAVAEVLVRPRREESEESVRDFAARRFGGAVADRLVRTAMLGIFAGDAERLSLDACFPEVRSLERERGSVIRGALARRRAARDSAAPDRRLTSYLGGLQELPRALARQPGVRVRHGVQAIAVERVSGGMREGCRLAVRMRDGDRIAADTVIVATPVTEAADLLDGLAPGAADLLRSIPVPPVAVVALGYPEAAMRGMPEGFGALVSRGEGLHMLGVLQDWRIYPGRAPSGHALVRVMYGGRLDPEVVLRDDGELVSLAREELRGVFGVVGEPVFSRVFRWPRAIPQYEIGHLEIRRQVRAEVERVDGLLLAGDALDGVSFVKTTATGIRQGRAAVMELAAREGSDRRVPCQEAETPLA